LSVRVKVVVECRVFVLSLVEALQL